jgi:A/G-specific adenine glycosylase
MLQQTTVAAVIPYFERFLTRFPTLLELAAAPESDVLRMWEGLGYYSRARNIHKAAQHIIQQHQGNFPNDLETLQSLPGIGRYTAGAIASFAFDRVAPIVEANTLRLYSRLLGYEGDPRSKEGQQILWSFAEAILPRQSPGQVNQALMELGATICSPREPKCEICPVHEYCRAFHDKTQASIPRPKQTIAITEVTEVSIAIRRGSEFLLRRRTANERWAGLWDFIRFEIDSNKNRVNLEHLTQTVLDRTGLSVQLGSQLTEMRHGVTRYQITLKCFTAQRIKGRLKASEEWNWVKPNQFSEYALSVTARKFADQLISEAATSTC